MIPVFAPSSYLSITIESVGGEDDIHVHPAGQGYWVARMLDVLGHPTSLCTPVGGETGNVFRALLGAAGDAAGGLLESTTATGAYVHDRRDGDRREVARMRPPALPRHTLDDLVSNTLALGVEAGIVVLCGSNLDGSVPPDTFRRLTSSLVSAGVRVVADLSGDEMAAAIEGGVTLLKVSRDELVEAGWSASGRAHDLAVAIDRLQQRGVEHVVVSCDTDGAIGGFGEQRWSAVAPSMHVTDHRGAGDSMTAGLAAALERGVDAQGAMRLATAAAAVNVIRHGLGSGHRAAIESLAELVEVTQTR